MKYDVVIIGAGPAGLSAGIFAIRAGLKVLCLESLAVGGQANLAINVENYPAFEKISGIDLCDKMKTQMLNCGAELKFENVVDLKKNDTEFEINTTDNKYVASKVIIASGAKPRRTGLENEKKFIGKGLSYCASCDGNFFKNKTVAVIGGGNVACSDVQYLSGIAKSVYMINRTEKFRADINELEKVKEKKNVTILTNAVVTGLNGDEVLNEITIKQNGETKSLAVDGLFVAIGYEPDLTFLNIDVELDKVGYVIVDERQETSVKNLFACGDITSKQFKQIITACADGARAGNSCIGG